MTSIATIHIPAAALEAGARAIASNRETEWAYMLKEDKDWCRAEARAAFEAMVEHWPGAGVEGHITPHLILPLTENPDAEA